jgi:hypothetical protein
MMISNSTRTAAPKQAAGTSSHFEAGKMSAASASPAE